MINWESNRGRWISLRAVVSSFLIKYFSLLKYQRFYFYLSYITALKNCHFTFHSLKNPLLTSHLILLYSLENLLSLVAFGK